MPAGTEGRSPRRGRTALGVVALIVAIGLGAAGVWLIVTGDSKQAKIGVLLGLWGLLLGAYQVVGGRHANDEPAAPVEPAAGTALETRESADALREYEQRLEAMLRRQIELMGAEMATMRAELATLRSELVEKVGGQLRLERTETTRLIGSDIGALQNEVRQLAMRSALLVSDAPTLTHAPVPAAVVAAPEPAPEHVAPPARPEPRSASAAPTAPVVPNPYRPEPGEPVRPAESRSAEPGHVQAAPAGPATTPATAAATTVPTDPFADLPRLTPFRDDSPADPAAAGSSRPPAHGAFDAALGLTGTPSAPALPSGRHAQSSGDDPAGGGRRRRSEEGGGTNILAQILNRERASRS